MAIIDKRVHRFAAFARKPLVLSQGSLGAGVSTAVLIAPYQGFPAGQPPYAIYGYVVEAVQFFCTAFVPSVVVDLTNVSGISVLTATITPVAGSVVVGSLGALSLRRFKMTDVLRFTLSTGGGASLANPMHIVTIRPIPMADEAA